MQGGSSSSKNFSASVTRQLLPLTTPLHVLIKKMTEKALQQLYLVAWVLAAYSTTDKHCLLENFTAANTYLDVGEHHCSMQQSTADHGRPMTTLAKYRSTSTKKAYVYYTLCQYPILALV